MGLFNLWKNGRGTNLLESGYETSDLQEITAQTASLNIDAEKGVIRNVKILGSESNNKRRYLPEALKQAVTIYEGMKVNVNHGQAPGQRRDLEDLIGVLRNVHIQEDGVFGDLHFNPKHRFADQLLWSAENDSANIGLSHDATCRHSREGGVMIIQEITDVKSCDLVGQPATTCGLFESKEPKTMRKTILQIAQATKGTYGGSRLIKLCEQDEVVGEVPIAEVPVDVPAEASADDAIKAAFKAAILAVIEDDSLDSAAMMAKIRELLKAKDKIEDAGAGAEAGVEAVQATEQETQSNPAGKGGDGGGVKPDGKGDAGTVKELKEEVDRLKSKEAVRTLLGKHGNPVIEEDLFEALVELPNDKAREAVLKNLGKGRKGAERPKSRPVDTGTAKIHESDQWQNDPEVKDAKSFADAITQ